VVGSSESLPAFDHELALARSNFCSAVKQRVAGAATSRARGRRFVTAWPHGFFWHLTTAIVWSGLSSSKRLHRGGPSRSYSYLWHRPVCCNPVKADFLVDAAVEGVAMPQSAPPNATGMEAVDVRAACL